MEVPCLLYDPVNVCNLISGSSAFSEPSLYIWKFSIQALSKASCKDFEHYLISMQNERNMQEFEHSLVPPFFGIGMKTGSRWVITPSWLSQSLRQFLYSSSVYSWHLFLISSASVRTLQFLSFSVPILAWNIPLMSLIFLKRSRVLPTLLFFSISLHCPLKNAFHLSLLFSGTLHSLGSIFPFFPCFSLLFFSQLFVKPPHTSTLPSCISFSWGRFWWLPPV